MDFVFWVCMLLVAVTCFITGIKTIIIFFDKKEKEKKEEKSDMLSKKP